MIPNPSQLASSGSQPRRYHQNEPRAPYDSRGFTMQSHRPKPKGATPIQMNSSLDWSNANRAYNSPFILVSNSTVFNGVPTVPSFLPNSALGQADQTGQYSYLPTGVWPSPMVTGAYSSWPYMANYDMQHGTKQPAWDVPEDNKEANGEDNAQVQYYPSNLSHGIDGSAMSNYPYEGMVPPQLCHMPLPLQMMKTHNGYVVQDLEALTQQDPAIPRAVPAMWTNPSELTLAKCLENREGIRNVYIRGFLPETTDEVLHAYAARFGKIDRCKAIVDLDTGLCKGLPDPDMLGPRDKEIGLNVGFSQYGIWIEKEVEDFIYGEGGNPLMDRGMIFRKILHRGVGVLRDALDPDFESPNV